MKPQHTSDVFRPFAWPSSGGNTFINFLGVVTLIKLDGILYR
jgi:hypothetical protein